MASDRESIVFFLPPTRIKQLQHDDGLNSHARVLLKPNGPYNFNKVGTYPKVVSDEEVREWAKEKYGDYPIAIYRAPTGKGRGRNYPEGKYTIVDDTEQ